MIFLLRIMLKLLFAPVILILALFVWLCTWLVCVSSVLLGLVSAVLFIIALAILLLSASVEGFIIYLVLVPGAGVSGQSIRATGGCPLAAEQSSGNTVLHSGKDLRLIHEEKTRPLLQGMWRIQGK